MMHTPEQHYDAAERVLAHAARNDDGEQWAIYGAVVAVAEGVLGILARLNVPQGQAERERAATALMEDAWRQVGIARAGRREAERERDDVQRGLLRRLDTLEHAIDNGTAAQTLAELRAERDALLRDVEPATNPQTVHPWRPPANSRWRDDASGRRGDEWVADDEGWLRPVDPALGTLPREAWEVLGRYGPMTRVPDGPEPGAEPAPEADSSLPPAALYTLLGDLEHLGYLSKSGRTALNEAVQAAHDTCEYMDAAWFDTWAAAWQRAMQTDGGAS